MEEISWYNHGAEYAEPEKEERVDFLNQIRIMPTLYYDPLFSVSNFISVLTSR